MLLFIRADERLFEHALAFEKEIFGIGDGLDENGKSACVAGAPNVCEDLVADHGNLRGLHAEMRAGRLDGTREGLFALAGRKCADLTVEKLYAGRVIIGGYGDGESRISERIDPGEYLLGRFCHTVGDKGVINIENDGADTAGEKVLCLDIKGAVVHHVRNKRIIFHSDPFPKYSMINHILTSFPHKRKSFSLF